MHVAILWNFLLSPTGAWIEYIYLKRMGNIVNIPSIIQKGASISFYTMMAVVTNSPFSSSKVDFQTRNCWSLTFNRLLEFYLHLVSACQVAEVLVFHAASRNSFTSNYDLLKSHI